MFRIGWLFVAFALLFAGFAGARVMAATSDLDGAIGAREVACDGDDGSGQDEGSPPVEPSADDEEDSDEEIGGTCATSHVVGPPADCPIHAPRWARGIGHASGRSGTLERPPRA